MIVATTDLSFKLSCYFCPVFSVLSVLILFFLFFVSGVVIFFFLFDGSFDLELCEQDIVLMF
jgi:hypothetical protein